MFWKSFLQFIDSLQGECHHWYSALNWPGRGLYNLGCLPDTLLRLHGCSIPYLAILSSSLSCLILSFLISLALSDISNIQTHVVSSIYSKYRKEVKHTWTKSSFIQGLISRCVLRLFKNHLDARHVLRMSVHCVMLRGVIIHSTVHLHWLEWAENCYCHSSRCNFVWVRLQWFVLSGGNKCSWSYP